MTADIIFDVYNALDRTLYCNRCKASTDDLYAFTDRERIIVEIPSQWSVINDKFLCPKCTKELRKQTKHFVKGAE